MGKTEQELVSIIRKQDIKRKNDVELKRLEKSARMFDKLVKSGVVKKRGNNLLPIDKAHKQVFRFNK